MFDGTNTAARLSWTCFVDQTNSIDVGNRMIVVTMEQHNVYDPNKPLI
jgi:hypothetical protein